jgi:hypothetical protein
VDRGGCRSSSTCRRNQTRCGLPACRAASLCDRSVSKAGHAGPRRPIERSGSIGQEEGASWRESRLPERETDARFPPTMKVVPLADGPLLLSDRPMAYRVPPAVDDDEQTSAWRKDVLGRTRLLAPLRHLPEGSSRLILSSSNPRPKSYPLLLGCCFYNLPSRVDDQRSIRASLWRLKFPSQWRSRTRRRRPAYICKAKFIRSPDLVIGEVTIIAIMCHSGRPCRRRRNR